MNLLQRSLFFCVVPALVVAPAAAQSHSWRYYRPGNTGIQGDEVTAIFIDSDSDPWIAGHVPVWEEGGVAKFVQAENRWINVSNVDYPVIGHPDDVGTSRVTDIITDGLGNLWMGTWRGALRMNLASGPTSLVKYGPGNSALPGGLVRDVERAPDGSLWFSSESTLWGGGGLTRYVPATDTWTHFVGQGGGRLAAQPKPGGGFYLWSSLAGLNGMSRWDSTTQEWTSYSSSPGQPAQLQAQDSVDAAGNVWMSRWIGNQGEQTLDCIRPDGTWVMPPLPPVHPVVLLAALKPFGTLQLLMVDGFGQLQRFDGSSWINLGPVPISGFIDDLEVDPSGNVWLCGIGGAARRDVQTGVWQRYRITNTGNCDSFNGDLAVDPLTGQVYATANAAPGVGGMTRFDGQRWLSWNNSTYGLGYDWPFLTDNCRALTVRPSNGRVVVSPADWIYGVHEWLGSSFQVLPGLDGTQHLVEDSFGRLWALGGTISLGYFSGGGWTTVPGISGGARLEADPTRPGTVWATSSHEILRTDGSYAFQRTIDDFPGHGAGFTGMAPEDDGVVWVGTWQQFTSTGSALIRLDAETGTFQSWKHDQGWPFPGEHVRPLAVSPDGRVWMQYDSEFPSDDMGLCWFDGTNVGKFQAPPGGVPQWGGLPHATINDLEVRPIPGGYELWMSFGSRGIAVLSVLDAPLGKEFCAGDGSASGAGCPCGNDSAAGSQTGCLNSTGLGARLSASGSASVSADDLQLQAAQLPTSVFGLVFMGGSSIAATPFGDGLRCIGSQIHRFEVRHSGAAGAFSYGPGQLAWIESHLPSSAWITAGSTWRFQAWYRDPAGPCGSGFNVSSAVEIAFTP